MKNGQDGAGLLMFEDIFKKQQKLSSIKPLMTNHTGKSSITETEARQMMLKYQAHYTAHIKKGKASRSNRKGNKSPAALEIID